MSLKALIFDMDGTLWDSAENVAISWMEVLKDIKDLDREVTMEDIQGVMGLPMDEIAKRLFAGVSEERQMEIMDACGSYENEYLREKGGILYPKLEETLKKLKEKYRLFIVSNCQQGYIEAFLDHYNLWDYFEDKLCWGDTKVSKGESIKILMEKNGVTDAAYVGDIYGDYQSAKYAGIPFIFAEYGFGDVEEPDAVIYSFEELIEVADTL